MFVGDLAGGIAESARLVEQLQMKPPRPGSFAARPVTANRGPPGVMLAVQRVVVGEHERRNLGGRSGVCSNGP